MTFSEAIVSPPEEHHDDFDIDPVEWNRKLSEDATRVARSWKTRGHWLSVLTSSGAEAGKRPVGGHSSSGCGCEMGHF